MLSRLKTFSAVAIAASALATGSSAATLSCAVAASNGAIELDVTNYVAANSGCNVGNDKQDFINGGVAKQVNEDAIFGINNWTFIARDNTAGDPAAPDTGDSTAFSLKGDTEAGGWNLFDQAFGSYMMVFKGGNSGYIGYLLSGTKGVYSSPLFKSNGNQQGISHVSLYGVGPQVVPLPASAALLLSGFAGIGLMGRRKKTK